MIIFEYIPAAKGEAVYFAGVPLRDLTQDDVAVLSKEVVAAIAASDFYRRVEPAKKVKHE